MEIETSLFFSPVHASESENAAFRTGRGDGTGCLSDASLILCLARERLISYNLRVRSVRFEAIL